jgi:hypothetical protein
VSKLDEKKNLPNSGIMYETDVFVEFKLHFISMQIFITNEAQIVITESSASASYLDVLLNIDVGGKLKTQLYYKRDDFDLPLSTSHMHVATSHYRLHMAYS